MQRWMGANLAAPLILRLPPAVVEGKCLLPVHPVAPQWEKALALGSVPQVMEQAGAALALGAAVVPPNRCMSGWQESCGLRRVAGSLRCHYLAIPAPASEVAVPSRPGRRRSSSSKEWAAVALVALDRDRELSNRPSMATIPPLMVNSSNFSPTTCTGLGAVSSPLSSSDECCKGKTSISGHFPLRGHQARLRRPKG